MNENNINWDSFLSNLWNSENALGLAQVNGVGGFKNGKYYPYLTSNDDLDIGPGFDLNAVLDN